MDKLMLGQMAEIAHALANETRLQVLYTLRDREMTRAELSAVIGVASPGISNLLLSLQRHGLVRSRREGRHVHYRVIDPHVMEACEAIRLHHVNNLTEKTALLAALR